MWRSRWMVCVLLCAVGGGGFAALEKTPKQVFEERFGPAYRKAIASRATEDEIALAGELVAAAKESTDNIPLLTELCDNALVLGVRDAAGFDIAEQAVEVIAAYAPDKAPVAREKLVTFFRRSVALSKGAEQTAAAQRLVSFLTRQADSRVTASDFGGAAKIYQQAIKAAEDAKLTDLDTLKAKFDSAAGREKLELRIETASEKLATDPNNVVAATELLQIYLIEKDDPEQALRYAKTGGNDAAKKLLPLAAGSMDALTAAEALEVAEWYESMIGDAPLHTKPALIRRARSFYDQFLLTPGSDKLLQVKVSLAINRLREALAKASPEEAKAFAAVDENGFTDLFATLEPQRYRLAGKWRRSEKGVFGSAPEGSHGRITLPAAPRGGYELHVKFSKLTGEGPVSILLPAGDRTVRLVLGGYGNKVAGLYSLTGEALEEGTGVRRNATTVPFEIALETEYAVAVNTRLRGTNATIVVEQNGEKLIEWTGPRSDLRGEEAWALHEPVAIGLGVSSGSVQFHAAKVRSFRGDAVLLPKPTTLAERGVVTPSDGFIDALELWDPAKDSYDGDWARELDAAVIDRINKRSQNPRTRIPVIPDGDYTLRARMTCGDSRRGGGPAIYLPLKNTGVLLALGVGQRSNLAGLSHIDGKDAASNDSTVKCPAFEAGKQYAIEVRVKVKDDQATIEADLDGEKLLRWDGPRASLTLAPGWNVGDGRSPAIAMHMAEFSYELVDLRVDAGSAPLVRQPPKKIIVDKTPVDLLKMVDLRKHVAAGTWTTEAGKLTASTAGLRDSAALMLPAAPKGNYELKVKFARSGGRPIVHLYLPVAGTGFVVDFGSNDGKTGGIAAPARPGDGNLVGNGEVRFVNNSVYTAVAKVESKAGEVSVHIELDGKPYLHWKGDPSLLRQGTQVLPQTFNTATPGFVVTNPVVRSSATIAEVQLKMSTGNAGLMN